jgi:hypothetical protein
MKRRRDAAITVFVIAWLLVFVYETLRFGFLIPLVNRPLPKLPLLFPPAGWIMFFHIDRGYGFAEVYGARGEAVERIAPEAVFSTRTVGYDNFRRNILVGVVYREEAPAFCEYLRRRFPAYQEFAVVYAQHPDVVDRPDLVQRAISYRCR